MGLYDSVKIDMFHGDHGIAPGTMFQTKSLYACCNQFSINAAGKLVEHLYRFEPDAGEFHPYTGRRLSKAIHIGDEVIEYHGDILLRSEELGPGNQDFVARFTHGTLERLIPLSEYSENQLMLVLSQGER